MSAKKEPGRPEVGHLTHPGQHRRLNEDSYGLPPPDLSPEVEAAKGRLYVVADGVGGHEGGEVASKLAVARVLEEYYRDTSQDWRTSLLQAVHLANAAVYQLGARARGRARPASTLTAAVVRGPELLVANVGDSRVYLVRGGVGQQLTQDHTPVAEGIRKGLIDPAQAARHPQQGQISRALGKSPDVQPDLFLYRLEPGDKILLCSDGLTNEVGDSQLFSIVERSQDAQRAVSSLVSLANRNGGRDNITALVVGLNGYQSEGRGVLSVGWMVLAASALAVLLIAGGFAAWIATSTTPTPTGTATETLVVSTAPATAVGDAAQTQTAEAQTAEPSSEVTDSPTPTPSATGTPTPAPYPTPQLQLPPDADEIEGSDIITLTWSWAPELGEGEYFQVQVWREGEEERIVDERTKVLSYTLTLTDLQPIPGVYHWQIMVNRELAGVREPLAVTEERSFSLSISPPPEDHFNSPPPDGQEESG